MSKEVEEFLNMLEKQRDPTGAKKKEEEEKYRLFVERENRERREREEKKTNAEFYESYNWKRLRYEVLRKHGFKCLACNKGAKENVILHIDHIKPRSKFPELELDPENLQVLCAECNQGKSNRYQDDFTHKEVQKPIRPNFSQEHDQEKLSPKVKMARAAQHIKKRIAIAEAERDIDKYTQIMKFYLLAQKAMVKDETFNVDHFYEKVMNEAWDIEEQAS